MTTQLYLISPPQIELASFRKELEAALSAGEKNEPSAREAAPHVSDSSSRSGGTKNIVGAFQLRLKDVDDAAIKRAIKELMPVCRAHQVIFIINDRADLCAEFACDGVHVGQEDLQQANIAAIRNLIGDKAAIGVTCHASKHLAMEAGEAGADYVAFGAFYPTTSKPKEKLEKWGTPTADILEWWSTYMTVPCVAIGGITPENCKPLVEAGADFIAVITAVWNHPRGVEAAIAEFSNVLRG